MSDQPAERMIPILPCRSIDDQIGFYESLGFAVIYRQKAPNVYASVQRGGIEPAPRKPPSTPARWGAQTRWVAGPVRAARIVLHTTIGGASNG